MIDFWARVDESDVDDFIKTLALPDYMSHLKVAPFSIAEQASSATGREPLKLLCFGPGRLEDLSLDPFQYAAKLIESLAIGLDGEKTQVPTSGAVWTWREFGPSHPFYDTPSNDAKGEKERAAVPGERAKRNGKKFDDEAFDAARKIVFDERPVANYLRVYFKPKKPFEAEETFDARDAYVSVSRCEIFLSWRVVKVYVESRCRDLLVAKRGESTIFDKNIAPTEAANAENEAARRTPETTERVDFAWSKNFGTLNENDVDASDEPSSIDVAPEVETRADVRETTERLEKESVAECARKSETNVDAPIFRFELDGRRAMFQFGALAGAFDVDSSEFIGDALRFAGLTRTLERLDNYVRFCPKRYPARTNGLGITLKLDPAPKTNE